MPTVSLPAFYTRTHYSTLQQPGYPLAVITNTAYPGYPLWGSPGLRTTAVDVNYRDKIRTQINATNNYSIRSLVDWRLKRAYCHCRRLPYFTASISEMMSHGDGIMTTGVTDAVLQDQALTALKRKLKTQIKSFQSLVPLAEIRDLSTTVRGAVDLTRTLLHTVGDIKRTRGRSAFRYASKAWLTYGFGIRPILADIRAINESISSYLNRSDRNAVRLVGTARKSWLTTGVNSNISYNFLATASTRTDIRHELSYRYVASFNLPLKSANDYGAMQHFGLDLPSLIPAIWEATMFSWVFDYFGTVGAYLEDVFESPPGNAIYVSLNRRYIARIHSTIYPVYQSNVEVVSNVNGEAKGTYIEFDRTSLPGPTLPRSALRFKTADEVGFHGVNKLLNLASVILANR